MNDDHSSSEQPRKRWFHKLLAPFHNEPQTREELAELLQDACDRDLFDKDALTLIDGALNLTDMLVEEIMIPRSQMVVVKVDQHPRDFLPLLIESAHSRFPVIGESTDEILGILLAKDLLPLVTDPQALEAFDMRSLLRPATFVPEYKRLYSMLREFRETHNHMAIVVDEYGAVAGLVTIEDVLEQIVGEIEDEHDVEDEEDIRATTENTYLVKALTPVEDFNEFFHTRLSDEEFDTVGGLVMQRFGHLPQRGEKTEINGMEFTVVYVDNRRIRLLQVRRQEDSDKPGNSAD